jgi:two-component system response regulator MprA
MVDRKSCDIIVLVADEVLHGDTELLDFVRQAGAVVNVLSLSALLADASVISRSAVVLLGVGASIPCRAAHRVRRLRSSGIGRPVLLVALRDAPDAIAAALRAGASDFVRRASARLELRLRLRALEHRGAGWRSPQRLRLGVVEVDRSTRVMRCGDRAVSLTNREYRLLECLAAHPGEPVSREILEQHVWGGPAKRAHGSNVVDVYIAYLRRKLSTLGVSEAVRTYRGIGYTITNDLQPVEQ